MLSKQHLRTSIHDPTPYIIVSVKVPTRCKNLRKCNALEVTFKTIRQGPYLTKHIRFNVLYCGMHYSALHCCFTH